MSFRASSVLLRDRVPCILGKTWRTLLKLAVSVLKFQSTQCTERCDFGWRGDGDSGGTRPRRSAKSGAIGSYAARHVWLHRRARAFDGRLSNGSSPMLSASIDVRGQVVRGHQLVASRCSEPCRTIP
eukprot:scaffold99217_cov35-Phaeocystis_antarctica.AAC.1